METSAQSPVHRRTGRNRRSGNTRGSLIPGPGSKTTGKRA